MLRETTFHRLSKIRDHLANNVEDEKFDLISWSCGTTACVMGHACSIPEFREMGLHLKKAHNFSDYFQIFFQENAGMMAVAKFLDMYEGNYFLTPLSPKENGMRACNYLFLVSHHGNASKASVIERIDQFIKDNHS